MTDAPAPIEHDFDAGGKCRGCGFYVEELIYARFCQLPALARPVIHKRGLPAPGCGMMAPADETTLYWDSVTCGICRSMMPPDASGRTSIKHSYTGEGINHVD